MQINAFRAGARAAPRRFPHPSPEFAPGRGRSPRGTGATRPARGGAPPAKKTERRGRQPAKRPAPRSPARWCRAPRRMPGGRRGGERHAAEPLGDHGCRQGESRGAMVSRFECQQRVETAVPHPRARRVAIAGRCHACRAPGPRRSGGAPSCRGHARAGRWCRHPSSGVVIFTLSHGRATGPALLRRFGPGVPATAALGGRTKPLSR